MRKMANIPTNFAKIFTRNRYKRPRHIEYLEKKLVQVYNGEIDRLIITMPPRHGKSELTSKYFPAWWLLNNPAARIILVSYESQFASRWSMAAKEIYRRFRPGDMLKIDQQDYWLTPAGGFMNAIGVGGAITGKGADLIIVDDPVKNDEQALSGTYRNKTFSFFNSTLYTRLEPGGRIVIIQTRWHKDDLAGRLLEAAQSGDGDKWDVVNLPAIADGDCVLGREAGEALWPERFSLENIDKIKKQLGSYWFSALYQQDPISGEHQIINPDLWQYYSPDMIDEKPYIIQVWDTAFKSGEMNDYTACTTWICNRFGFFLIDLFHGKPAYPELKKQLEIQYDRHKPMRILIEDAASGQSLLQDMKKGFPVTAVKPENKISRAHLVTPLFEQKLVHLPKGFSQNSRIINECAEFPYGAHDDIVDSVTMALRNMQPVYEQLSGERSQRRLPTRQKVSKNFRNVI